MSRIAFLLGYDLLEPKLDRRVLLEAQSCLARGHAVEVLCWARRQPHREPAGSYGGVVFHRLYQELGVESRPFPLKVPGYLALVRQMLRRLATFDPDVVIAADLEMLPAAVTGRLFLGYGLIYDSHEDWPAMEAQTSPALGFATKLLERSLLPAVDAVVTVNDTLAEPGIDGRFSLEVGLDVGANIMEVVASGEQEGQRRKRLISSLANLYCGYLVHYLSVIRTEKNRSGAGDQVLSLGFVEEWMRRLQDEFVRQKMYFIEGIDSELIVE